MARLVLLILLVSQVFCDSHVLRCLETVASSPAPGLPVYSVVVYVDDKMISNFTSDTRHYFPKVEWLKKLEAEYWEKEKRRSLGNLHSHMQDLQNLMKRLNETKGLHVYQVMYGCELRDDSSTAGYMQDGYDGRDYMYLDTKSGIYIPTMNEAQITTQKYNSPEIRLGERNKYTLESDCLYYLSKFIVYGRTELEKRVPPEVKVSGHQSDGVTRLHCLVYGFHPRAVDVKWVRNGIDLIISDEASPILPHPDGTYQIRVSVEVPTIEGDTYSCHVDHSSMEQILIVNWEPANGLTAGVLAGAVIGSLLVAALVTAGVCIYRKKNNGYRSTNTSEITPTHVQPE